MAGRRRRRQSRKTGTAALCGGMREGRRGRWPAIAWRQGQARGSQAPPPAHQEAACCVLRAACCCTEMEAMDKVLSLKQIIPARLRGCAATARLPGLQGQGVRGGPLASVAPSPARVEWTLHRHEGPGTLLRPARAAGQGSVICYRVTVLHRRTSRTPQIGQEHRMRMGRPWCCRGGATAAAAEHAVLVHDGFFPPVCAPSASLGAGG